MFTDYIALGHQHYVVLGGIVRDSFCGHTHEQYQNRLFSIYGGSDIKMMRTKDFCRGEKRFHMVSPHIP